MDPHRWRRWPWLASFVLVAVFLAAAGSVVVRALERLETRERQQIGEALDVVLAQVTGALQLWIEDRKQDTAALAASPSVREAVRPLVDLPPEALAQRGAAQLRALRARLAPTLQREEDIGFSVLDADGVRRASTRDRDLGEISPIAIQHPRLLERAFAGETVFVPPTRTASAETRIPTVRPTTAFILAPVRDRGSIRAVLKLWIDLSQDFNQTTRLGRIGATGKTYAFDVDGWMITESLPEGEQDGSPASERSGTPEREAIRVAVPPDADDPARLHPEDWPLTEMASSALRGETGSNLDGYLDYRGRAVLGSWAWDPDLGIGLTVEIDQAEALAIVQRVRSTVLSALGAIVTLSLGLGIAILWVRGRSETALRRARDQLERRVVERTRELHEANLSLHESLVEKQALLGEIHHRVKNNLQVVSSLLFLQAHRLEKGPAATALLDSRERVRAMALVHETLYRSPELSRVDFAEYASSLIAHIRRSMMTATSAISFELSIENLEMDAETALPCGLVLNELVVNALKHAFPEGTGTVAISMHRRGASYHLEVADDGVGIPAAVEPGASGSLGLDLVRTLTEQLRGKLTVTSDHGASFAVDFPVERA